MTAENNREHRQMVVALWCRKAFGDEVFFDRETRGERLVEEALEAAQAVGVSRERMMRLVDVVFSRPVGEIGQEIGGVGVTLLALAACAGISADDAETREVRRVLTKDIEHFRRRNAEKVRLLSTPPVADAIGIMHVIATRKALQHLAETIEAQQAMRDDSWKPDFEAGLVALDALAKRLEAP